MGSAATVVTSASGRSTWLRPRYAGIVVITVIIGAFLVEVARGHDGSPYAALGAVAGVAYLVAIVAPARAWLTRASDFVLAWAFRENRKSSVRTV